MGCEKGNGRLRGQTVPELAIAGFHPRMAPLLVGTYQWMASLALTVSSSRKWRWQWEMEVYSLGFLSGLRLAHTHLTAEYLRRSISRDAGSWGRGHAEVF